MEFFIKFFKEKKGMELSEYAIMAALVITVTMAPVIALGDQVSARMSQVVAILDGQTG